MDCLLDDIRFGRESKITRMMERKQDEFKNEDNIETSSSPDIVRSMFDITFQQKKNESFGELHYIILIINLLFLY